MDDAILGQRFVRRDDARGAVGPTVANLASDRGAIETPRERLAQHFGQPRDRGQHAHRIAMHEDEARIGINFADRIECEDVIGAFQHPALSRLPVAREMLEEAAMKAIGFADGRRLEPGAIGRHVMRRVEAQAGEDMRGDLAAFLRRRRASSGCIASKSGARQRNNLSWRSTCADRAASPAASPAIQDGSSASSAARALAGSSIRRYAEISCRCAAGR